MRASGPPTLVTTKSCGEADLGYRMAQPVDDAIVRPHSLHGETQYRFAHNLPCLVIQGLQQRGTSGVVPELSQATGSLLAHLPVLVVQGKDEIVKHKCAVVVRNGLNRRTPNQGFIVP